MRFVAVGRIRSAMSEREDQVLWALLEIILVSYVVVGWLFGGVVFWVRG